MPFGRSSAPFVGSPSWQPSSDTRITLSTVAFPRLLRPLSVTRPQPRIVCWILCGHYSDQGIQGASSVLLYGAIESPLAQPRALIGGHMIACVVGVCYTKIFSLIPSEQRLESLRWLAGALSTATSIVLMEITATTHPPAGATALLAAIDADIYNMGWYLIPVILLSTVLMLILAMIINNIQRRYPMFWFAPAIPPVAQSSPGLGAPEKRIATLEAFVPDRFVSTASTDVELGLFRKGPFLPISSSHTVIYPSRLSTASSAKTARLTRRHSM